MHAWNGMAVKDDIHYGIINTGEGGGGSQEAKSGCCFWVGYGGRSERKKTGWLEGMNEQEKEKGWWWWRRAVMKVREWSERVTGSRWKHFMPRMRRHGKEGADPQWGGGRFRYDPLSYSLNFDEADDDDDGDGDGEKEVVGFHRDFSSRWASIPATSSMSSIHMEGPHLSFT